MKAIAGTRGKPLHGLMQEHTPSLKFTFRWSGQITLPSRQFLTLLSITPYIAQANVVYPANMLLNQLSAYIHDTSTAVDVLSTSEFCNSCSLPPGFVLSAMALSHLESLVCSVFTSILASATRFFAISPPVADQSQPLSSSAMDRRYA